MDELLEFFLSLNEPNIWEKLNKLNPINPYHRRFVQFKNESRSITYPDYRPTLKSYFNFLQISVKNCEVKTLKAIIKLKNQLNEKETMMLFEVLCESKFEANLSEQYLQEMLLQASQMISKPTDKNEKLFTFNDLILLFLQNVTGIWTPSCSLPFQDKIIKGIEKNQKPFNLNENKILVPNQAPGAFKVLEEVCKRSHIYQREAAEELINIGKEKKFPLDSIAVLLTAMTVGDVKNYINQLLGDNRPVELKSVNWYSTLYGLPIHKLKDISRVVGSLSVFCKKSQLKTAVRDWIEMIKMPNYHGVGIQLLTSLANTKSTNNCLGIIKSIMNLPPAKRINYLDGIVPPAVETTGEKINNELTDWETGIMKLPSFKPSVCK